MNGDAILNCVGECRKLEAPAGSRHGPIPKPRLVLITDAKQIEAIIAKGKYREHLPFWTRDGEALWVEKPVVKEEKFK